MMERMKDGIINNGKVVSEKLKRLRVRSGGEVEGLMEN
jgi:hypothetical protein